MSNSLSMCAVCESDHVSRMRCLPTARCTNTADTVLTRALSLPLYLSSPRLSHACSTAMLNKMDSVGGPSQNSSTFPYVSLVLRAPLVFVIPSVLDGNLYCFWVVLVTSL